MYTETEKIADAIREGGIIRLFDKEGNFLQEKDAHRVAAWLVKQGFTFLTK